MNSKLLPSWIFAAFLISQGALAARTKANTGTLRIQASINSNEDIRQEPTGFSPKKGKSKWIALDSPQKRRMKIVAKLDQKQATVIDSSHTDFSFGSWSFVDPIVPTTSFAISADHQAWERIIKKFNNTLPPSNLSEGFIEINFELFLNKLGHFIHDNILNIDALAVRSPAREEPVCRHYSTYISVLFSKLLSEEGRQWRAYIQVAAANIVESDLSLSQDGHAWNLVTVEDGQDKYYWLYDAYNYSYIKLTPTMRLSELRATYFKDNTNIIVKEVEKNSLFYNIAKVTIGRFQITNNANNLYNDKNEEAWLQLSEKITAKLGSKLTTQTRTISRKTQRPEECAGDTVERVTRRKIDF